MSRSDQTRIKSLNELTKIGFDGYAIGGLAVGQAQKEIFSILQNLKEHLPEDKPRYLMGVGRPSDLVDAVVSGCDMFDCVLPTRSGRTGQAFTWSGVVNIRNSRHKDDPRPLDESCKCPTCLGYSRAYLYHLVQAKEILGAILMTWHNLYYYQALMAGMRVAIRSGELNRFCANFTNSQKQGDVEPL